MQTRFEGSSQRPQFKIHSSPATHQTRRTRHFENLSAADHGGMLHQLNLLPSAFSPHNRKGQDRFLSGGWASQARGWILDASSPSAGFASDLTKGRMGLTEFPTSLESICSNHESPIEDGQMIFRVAAVKGSLASHFREAPSEQHEVDFDNALLDNPTESQTSALTLVHGVCYYKATGISDSTCVSRRDLKIALVGHGTTGGDQRSRKVADGWETRSRTTRRSIHRADEIIVGPSWWDLMFRSKMLDDIEGLQESTWLVSVGWHRLVDQEA